MNRKISVSTEDEAKEYIKRIKDSMNTTVKRIEESIQLNPGDLFYQMKFTEFGRDPLEDRNLNIIEQLNQLYTYLVSFKAIMYLLKEHKGMAPFIVNLGTQSGFDIHSSDESLVAEVFASADARNNDKLRNDIKRLTGLNSDYKYVFYHSPDICKRQFKYKEDFPDVKVVYFDSVS